MTTPSYSKTYRREDTPYSKHVKLTAHGPHALFGPCYPLTLICLPYSLSSCRCEDFFFENLLRYGRLYWPTWNVCIIGNMNPYYFIDQSNFFQKHDSFKFIKYISYVWHTLKRSHNFWDGCIYILLFLRCSYEMSKGHVQMRVISFLLFCVVITSKLGGCLTSSSFYLPDEIMKANSIVTIVT